MSQIVQSEQHPLLRPGLKYFGTWEEWKELWANTTQAEYLYSLIFYGFKTQLQEGEVGRAEEIERICAYLSLASYCPYQRDESSESKHSVLGRQEDRFGGDEYFPPDRGPSIRLCLSRIRDRLTQKAYEILVKEFFTPSHTWDRVKYSEVLLKKVVDFFDGGTGGFTNVPAHDRFRDFNRQALSFAAGSLCEHIWMPAYLRDQLHFGDFQKWRALEPNLMPYRTAVVMILHRTRRLHDLRRRDDHDEASLKVLHRLAFADEVSFGRGVNERHRAPRTLEEAVYGGSDAAEVLLHLLNDAKVVNDANARDNLKNAEPRPILKYEKMLRSPPEQ
jgi:hypothetical protein